MDQRAKASPPRGRGDAASSPQGAKHLGRPGVFLQPEQPVQVESSLCARHRCTKSQCAACAVVCPVPGAVRLAEEGAEITGACVGCGACVSACPNGALRPLEDDALLAQRIGERVQSAGVFRIACAQAQVRADLVLPCLSRLTEALVLAPLRGGALRVELAAPDCAACGFKKAAPQWEKVMAFCGALCESAGLAAERVARLRVASGKVEEVRPAAPASHPRRTLFRAVAERWTATGDAVAAAAAAPEPVAAEAFRDIVQRHSVNPKRTHLLQVLAAISAGKAAAKVVFAAAVPLAQLEVDNRCIGCNVCETLCPVGALAHREEGGNYLLELDAAHCTGCRVCEAACYRKALHVRDTVDVAVLFERRHVVLISAPRRTCPACGERILGDSSASCPSCQVSGDRRDAIARRFFVGGNQHDRS